MLAARVFAERAQQPRLEPRRRMRRRLSGASPFEHSRERRRRAGRIAVAAARCSRGARAARRSGDLALMLPAAPLAPARARLPRAAPAARRARVRARGPGSSRARRRWAQRAQLQCAASRRARSRCGERERVERAGRDPHRASEVSAALAAWLEAPSARSNSPRRTRRRRPPDTRPRRPGHHTSHARRPRVPPPH